MFELADLPYDAPDAHPEVPVPIQQSAAYAIAAGADRLALVHKGKMLAQMVVMQRRLGPVRMHALLRGPVWLVAPSATHWRKLHQLLHERYSSYVSNRLIWLPPETEQLPPPSDWGMQPLLSGGWHSWLEVRMAESALRHGMHGKWRNRLVKGEQQPMVLREYPAEGRILRWVLAAERAQSRHKGYRGVPGSWLRRLRDAGAEVRLLVAQEADDDWSAKHSLAAALFICHGHSATYQIGWVSSEGRERCAMHRLLWHGILLLKQNGTHWLDLGVLNGHSSDGLARFKLGTGAKAVQDAGVWVG